jgi:hypothetical protein
VPGRRARSWRCGARCGRRVGGDAATRCPARQRAHRRHGGSWWGLARRDGNAGDEDAEGDVSDEGRRLALFEPLPKAMVARDWVLVAPSLSRQSIDWNSLTIAQSLATIAWQFSVERGIEAASFGGRGGAGRAQEGGMISPYPAVTATTYLREVAVARAKGSATASRSRTTSRGHSRQRGPGSFRALLW